MKRKQPNPLTTSEINQEPEIIDVDNIESSHTSNAQSGSNKRSWVWSHMKESNDGKTVICQVAKKNGEICGTALKKDKSSSTKTFHGHLLLIHRLADPNLTKKTKMNQMSLDKWSKSGTCQPKVKLNSKTLKSAIVYMVAQYATPMIDSINQTSIATHIARMHHQSENTIKTNYISKQISISFTQDAWTAPNFTAFMTVTAHFIDEKFIMRNLTLAVPQVEGNHSGNFFAELFYNVLEKYSAINVMHTITADNASVNNKMARELDLQIPHFSSATHILGCVAHVINLAAKLGVAALGSTDNDNDGDKISMASLDSESNTGAGINTRTIIKRVHGMCTWVRFSPQRRERFGRCRTLLST
ncbi:hypothetical protein PSTT_02039 [Puccinia striiformis]|uniref:DUF659 domain-containing protein n=1 Tax=Puccinia striiformis TaxID=27350 RepID=A0A2S4W178_9BASI|nr:hypothetical protein PSTT_02039 [Puccinia striiformis]